MTPEELNERVKSLISRMEKVGARPSYTKGGSYNDFLEYWKRLFLCAVGSVAGHERAFRKKVRNGGRPRTVEGQIQRSSSIPRLHARKERKQ